LTADPERATVDGGRDSGDRVMSETRDAEPMTIEGIARDPWSAVTNAIPEAPSDELIKAARDATALCAEKAFRKLQAAPFGEMRGMDQDYNAAVVRRFELDEIYYAILEDRATNETRTAEPPSLTPEVAGKVRNALEIWEAWQQREFSTATIAADPWTAVYLPIPQNADASLLAAAQVAAVTCVGMVELGEQWYRPRVLQGEGPAEQQAKASSRFDELDARLAVLTPNENGPERIALVAVREETPEPEAAGGSEWDELLQKIQSYDYDAARDFMETALANANSAGDPVESKRWFGIFDAARARAEAVETPEPMTLAAIRADKWAAVDMAIPHNAEPLLLDQASFAALDCFNQREPPQGVAPEAWAERRAAAGERVKELGDRMEAVWDTLVRPERKDLRAAIDHAEAVRAWQAPAFSFDTIHADPWTAVYLPIPENAGADLLEHARSWAADLAEYAARDQIETQGAFTGPLITMPADAPEPLAAATARMAELSHQIEINNPGYSRWTGEPLGEAAGVAQSAGKGQSHR
jgi:hypothetical protein